MAKSKEKVALSLDAQLVDWVDSLVEAGEFASRSAAFEEAMWSLRQRLREERYEYALAQLDPAEERAMAEEGMDEYGKLVLSSTEWDEGANERAV